MGKDLTGSLVSGKNQLDNRQVGARNQGLRGREGSFLQWTIVSFDISY